eukprot:TRINITY_DN80505_c0_g1_i1.p1 TRINITY_DN80505_c0_g1~~TRINITY_DN80505_c0_g1_i1.p1  ORF type:complete len:2533 (-),score=561.46 TRINITY_DN80505_c0_g1_i1:262-7860(-)
MADVAATAAAAETSRHGASPLLLPNTGSYSARGNASDVAPSRDMSPSPSQPANGGKLPKVRQKRGHPGDGVWKGVSFTVTPIWLGSGTKEENIVVKAMRDIVPEDLHGNENVLIIERFEDDAMYYISQQKYIMAAECYEQAINLRRKFLGGAHQDFLASIERYIVSCNLWGIGCLKTGEYTTSLELLKKAEVMTEAANVPNFKRRIALRASTFSNLCCYFRHRGKLNAAMQFAEKALKIEQRFKDAEDPARTHLNYAVLLSMTNRHEEAIEHIESAISILHDEERQIFYERTRLDTDDSEVDDAAKHLAKTSERHKEVIAVLVVAYYNMFVELSRLSRRDMALDFIARASDIAKTKLGPSHSLTLKMAEAEATMQEVISKTPGYAHTPDFLQAAATTNTAAAEGTGMPEGSSCAKATGSPSPLTPPLMPLVPLASPRAHATAQEALEDAKQITLRYQYDLVASSRRKPPGLLKPCEKAPFERGLKQLELPEHIYGRFMKPIPAEAAKSIIRPKSRESQARVGSPMLQHEIHGATLRALASSRAGERSAGPSPVQGNGGTASPIDNLSNAGLLPPQNQPKAAIDAALAPHLRAAYEYHKTQRQLSERIQEDDEVPALAESSERLGALQVFKTRLAERRAWTQQVPTDNNRERAATKIQAYFRRYLVRCWHLDELAKQARRRRATGDDGRSGARSTTPSIRLVTPDAELMATDEPGVSQTKYQPPADMKQRVALRVVYAARRAFVEYSAAVKIQKRWRGWLLRHDLSREVAHVAQTFATKLQALIRRYNVVSRMCYLHASATRIQKSWRRFLARRHVKERRAAAHTMVRAAQRYVTAKRLRLQTASAQVIQRQYRAYVVRCHLHARHRGALAFQQAWRIWLAWQLLERRRRAGYRIMALWRGHASRQWLQRRHTAAKYIQRRWTAVRERRLNQRSHRAVTRVAASWRGRVFARRRPLRQAATRLQAVVRGRNSRSFQKHSVLYMVRRLQQSWKQYSFRLKLWRSVALVVVVQKYARRVLTLSKLGVVTGATLACQTIQRGRYARWLVGHRNKQATRLQAYWRSRAVRCRIARAAHAAQRIQECFRSSFRRGRYKAMRSAVSRIRGGWVGHLLRRRNRKECSAAGTLGRMLRGRMVGLKLARRRAAVCKLQRWWRRCSGIRLALRRRHKAARAIQTFVRCRQRRLRFLLLRSAAVIVQTNMKRAVAHMRYRRKRRLARVVQALWRGCEGRRLVRCRQDAAVAIQCRWRYSRKQLRLKKTQAAATKLQARYLGFNTRRLLKRQHKAAIAIQSYVRRYLASPIRKSGIGSGVQRRRAAAATINSWLRGRAVRRRFLLRREAAAYLQTSVRAYLARKRLSWMKKAFGYVSSHMAFRRTLLQKKVQEQIATSCQRIWRGRVERLRYNKELSGKKASAINIQSAIRGWLARRWMERRQKAATKFQAMWRCVSGMRALSKKKKVQRILAGILRCKKAYELQVRARRRATFLLKSVFRTFLAKRTLAVRTRSATIIQRFTRGFLTRKNVKFLHCVAPVPVQSYLRRKKAVREAEKLRALAFHSELKGQEDRLRRKDRRRYLAATRIQACQRMRSQRKKYHHMVRWALPKLQAFNRMILERMEWKLIKDSVLTIQKSLRAFCLLRLKARYNAAVIIQHAYRSHLVRGEGHHGLNDYATLVRACRTIQSAYRRYVQRWQYMRSLVAAVRLQATARMFLQRLRWMKWKNAATKLQSSLLKPRLASKRKGEQLGRICLIQSAMRGWTRRLKGHRECDAALLLQAYWRRSLQRHKLEKRSYQAAVKIQTFLRMCYQKSVAFPRRRGALVSMQSHARGFLARNQLKGKAAAARRIQQKVRLIRFRRVMVKKKWLVLALQRILRGMWGRRSVVSLVLGLNRVPAIMKAYQHREKTEGNRRSAATNIQRVYRGQVGRRRLRGMKKAAIVLQSYWRRHLAMQMKKSKLAAFEKIYALRHMWRHKHDTVAQEHVYYCALDAVMMKEFQSVREKSAAAAATMQRLARGFLGRARLRHRVEAATIVQSGARFYLDNRRVKRRRAALAKLQAHFDGAYQRRKYAYNMRLIRYLQKCIKARVERHDFLRKRSAQIMIARCFRGLLSKRKLMRLSKERAALTRGQRCLSLRGRFFKRRTSAIKIQALCRGWLVRDELRTWPKAVQRIASAWRRHHARMRFLRQRAAGSCLVNYMLARPQMQLRRQRKASATTLASFWRGRKARHVLAERQRAAAVIQKGWRNALDTRWYRNMVCDVLVEAKHLKVRRLGAHAGRVQAMRRRQLYRRCAFKKMRAVALRIQAWIRGCQARYHVEELRRMLPLQRKLRGMLTFRCVLVNDHLGRYTYHKAWEEVSIESSKSVMSQTPSFSAVTTRRSYKVRQPPKRNLVRVDVIPAASKQALARAVEPIQRLAKHYWYVRCVETIQRRMRGVLCRKRMALMHQKASQIQAVWRASGWVMRRKVASYAAVLVQAATRGMLIRLKAERAAEEALMRQLEQESRRSVHAFTYDKSQAILDAPPVTSKKLAILRARIASTMPD